MVVRFSQFQMGRGSKNFVLTSWIIFFSSPVRGLDADSRLASRIFLEVMEHRVVVSLGLL